MNIDRRQVIALLKDRGDHDKAAQAESELPEQVDTDRDHGVLAELGLEPKDLLGKLTGGL